MIFGFDDSPGVGLRAGPDSVPDPDVDLAPSAAGGEAVAILGGGCFWCVDGVYRQLDGVIDVVSGYAGGAADTANYEAVCRGNTGHAEVVKIRFDPSRITYGRILKIFFSVAHDPTQLNRQGNDVGTQYRSVIFHTDEAQRDVAERYVRQLEAADVFTAPIVTELAPLDIFHDGEPYHQDYAARNPTQPYIACISAPKIRKLRESFPELLKGRGTV
jgi:peptide-methionine (S)-S-oxide reductase